MRNVVGAVASKEDFFDRPREIKRIKRNLEAGANLQLAAPRRVGKTSILHYFLNNPLEGFAFVYVDVESARTKQDFYKKVYREILRSEELNNKKNLITQIKEKAGAALKRLKNVKIGSLGEIIFEDNDDVDYEDELISFLEGFDLKGDRLVIMIDEFPEVLLNMVEDECGTKAARHFLQSNREFRNKKALQGKVQFIYTGSNSLNLTVANLDSTELISDLPAMPVYLLEVDQARQLIKTVLSTYGVQITEECIAYMIQSIEWLIPFYFQLVIQELLDILEEGEEITEEKIEKAIGLVLHPRNDNHFHHYIKRIKRVFGESKMKYIKNFLNRLSQEGNIHLNQAIDMAEGQLEPGEVKAVLNSLAVDGYIVEIADTPDIYKFNSPILKNWWRDQRNKQ